MISSPAAAIAVDVPGLVHEMVATGCQRVTGAAGRTCMPIPHAALLFGACISTAAHLVCEVQDGLIMLFNDQQLQSLGSHLNERLQPTCSVRFRTASSRGICGIGSAAAACCTPAPAPTACGRRRRGNGQRTSTDFGSLGSARAVSTPSAGQQQQDLGFMSAGNAAQRYVHRG